MGLMATGGERLGIYLNGLKISGSAQCLYKDRVLYHCTLLYDTDLTALHQALNPEPMDDDETLSSVYAVPSVRSEVTIFAGICRWGLSLISKKRLFSISVSRNLSVLSLRRR